MGMPISLILNYLKQGRRAARENFPQNTCIMSRQGALYYESIQNGKVVRSVRWTPVLDDLTASDWRIVEFGRVVT